MKENARGHHMSRQTFGQRASDLCFPDFRTWQTEMGMQFPGSVRCGRELERNL